MATNAPAALEWFANAWEHAIDTAEKRNDAATISGIVGDLAHRKSGGYHISRQDQPSTNYSVADCPPDSRGAADHASAVDMSMLPRDMVLVYGRLYASWADRNDPRLDHCRGINGTRDGKTAMRVDCQFHRTESATSDHLWHVHLEVLRQYNNDMTTMNDILSVIVGAPYGRATAAPVDARTQEDRMYHEPIPVGPGAGVQLAFPFDTNDNPAMSIATDTGPGGRAKATWRVAKHKGPGWTVVSVTTGTQDARRTDVPLEHGTDRVSIVRVAMDKDDPCDTRASVLCWW
jgi:hypothetical protein